MEIEAIHVSLERFYSLLHGLYMQNLYFHTWVSVERVHTTGYFGQSMLYRQNSTAYYFLMDEFCHLWFFILGSSQVKFRKFLITG